MHNVLRAAVIALALAGGTVTTVSTASAADVVVTTYNSATVAYGYNDGYWNQNHQWNKWEQPAHREAFRNTKGAEYHDWAHTRDADQGWHGK